MGAAILVILSADGPLRVFFSLFDETFFFDEPPGVAMILATLVVGGGATFFPSFFDKGVVILSAFFFILFDDTFFFDELPGVAMILATLLVGGDVTFFPSIFDKGLFSRELAEIIVTVGSPASALVEPSGAVAMGLLSGALLCMILSLAVLLSIPRIFRTNLDFCFPGAAHVSLPAVSP